MKNGMMQIGGYTITAELSQDGTLTAQVVNRATSEIEVEFLANRLTNETITPVEGGNHLDEGTARISDEGPAVAPTTSVKVEQVQPVESAFAERPGMQRSRIQPGPEE